MASTLLALLLFLTPLLATATPAQAQTTQTCGSSTCQVIFPAAIPYTGVAPVQSDPQPPVFGGDIFVSNTGSNTVSVIQGTTNIANVSVGASPLEPAFDAGNGLVYVPDSGGDTVSVLSGSSLEATVTVGSSPLTPAYDPANGDVYVPNSAGNSISVISGTAVIATLTVGMNPVQPVVDTDGGEYFGYVYVPNTGTESSGQGTVSVIAPQTDTVVDTIQLAEGGAPGAFFDSLNGYVYAGPYVISGTNQIAELSQGGCTATTCVLDPYNGDVYSPAGTTMFVISGNSSSSFNCQTCGSYATFDPLNGWVYAGWAVSGTLPFAYFEFSTESSGVHDASSFDPQTGAVYASCGQCFYDTNLNTPQQVQHQGNVAIILGNTCYQLPTGEVYNSTVSTICGGGAAPVMTNETMPLYNAATGLPEALGGHVFSVLIDSLNLVSGHWNATSADNATASFGKIQFTATGPSGTTGWATVTVPKVLVGLYLFAVLQGQGASAGLLARAAPTVYVDGQPVKATYFTSDSDNFYITFQVHFSTHLITLQFEPLALSNSTSTASSQSAASTGSTGSSAQTSTSTSSSSSSAASSTASSISLGQPYVLLLLADAVVVLVVLVRSAGIGKRKNYGGLAHPGHYSLGWV